MGKNGEQGMEMRPNLEAAQERAAAPPGGGLKAGFAATPAAGNMPLARVVRAEGRLAVALTVPTAGGREDVQVSAQKYTVARCHHRRIRRVDDGGAADELFGRFLHGHL